MATSVRDAEHATTDQLGLTTPIAGAVLLGLGLGGFFDGIVLHQLLQWHHMGTSAGFPPDSVENLKLNTLWDGFFHAATWIMTVAGVFLLERGSHRRHVRWPATLLVGGMLLGWGLFNTVEGLVDHHLLGIHHVNETVPPDQWLLWDVGFLLWGVAMVVAGWLLTRCSLDEVAARLRDAGDQPGLRGTNRRAA
ncbi:MAG: FIG028593: membrane protein [uncultured Chloroflexi bacterium]|uniref:FIG028593: membrane protein n=1 Tax=uncultured Chloroflexota bacterium TaxID=166587 RepID=A0A6J4ITZ6_9CHLR|nr:MAG: FIG028593: membrane protein [uncultured Chloroflexota bacterium]